MDTREADKLLERYMEERGVSPMIDVAAEMLNLERFLVPKPEFVDGVEYHGFYEPSDRAFQAAFLVDSMMLQPMGASNRLSRIVAAEYGLEHQEPIARNPNPYFHELAGCAMMNDLGVDDGSKVYEVFRKWFKDVTLRDLYPDCGSIQAAAAECEKHLPAEQLRARVGENTLVKKFSDAIDRGFDWIHVFNPWREGGPKEKASMIYGLAHLLKRNGVMVVQYHHNQYRDSAAVKEMLGSRGVKPAYEGGPLGLPFLGFLDSVDVYLKPSHN
jgi:hypothetical protein